MTQGLHARYLPITIGITGHINLDPESEGRAEIHLVDVLREVSVRFPHTPIRLLTSLAEGADRCAARAFLKFRAESQEFSQMQHEFIAALPLPKEHFVSDFPDSIPEFERILSHATAWFSMPLAEGFTESDLINGSSARNRQYRAASRYVAAHSDILVALWDGYDSDLEGGTCDTVRMRLQGMGVMTQLGTSPLARDGIRPVLHVGVERVVSPKAMMAEDILKHKNFYGELNKLLLSLPELESIDAFNRSAQQLVPVGEIEKSAANFFADVSLASRVLPFLCFCPRSCLELFATADALAIECEKRWKRLTHAIYGFGLLSACLLPMAVESVFLPWMLVGYFSVLGISALLYVYLRMAKIESLHVESRALAEILRVQFSLLLTDIEDPANLEKSSPGDGASFSIRITRILLGQQQRDLGWLYRSLDCLPLFRSPSDLRPAESDRRAFVLNWISGQSRYFHASYLKSERLAANFSVLSISLVALGLASAAGAIMLTLLRSYVGDEAQFHFLREVLVISAAALPICAVVVEKAAEHFGVEAHAKVRHRMHEVFITSHNRLSKEDDSEELRQRIIIETGREAVTEAVVWLFYRRIRPAKMSF